MTNKVTIPKFGWMMTEGTIVKWHKSEAVPGADAGVKAETAPADPTAEKAENEYDLCVIGGGPGGYVAAIKGAQEGLKTCLIEEKALGGTCLNIGCIPTKALLKSVDVLEIVREAETYGVKGVGADLQLDMEKVQARKNRIVRELTGGVGMLLQKNGAVVLNGRGSFVDQNTVKVGDALVKANNIVIATGSSTKALDIPVAKKMPLYTSDDVLALTEIPESVVVIGGGVIGVELAYFLAKAGAKVVIVEFMDKILPMIDSEITAIAEKYLKAVGIKIYTSAKVIGISEEGVVFEKDGASISETCSAVLMAVGRSPNTAGLELQNADIKTEKGAIVTDASLKTNVENIYAIGDVNGKYMLAHTASAEGLTVIDNILGKKETFHYSRVPSGIYLQPEIAAVGMTEEQARKEGRDIRIGKFPLVGNGKAKVEGCSDGLVKIIEDEKYGEILGVHMIAPHATDMIAEICAVMHLEGTSAEMLKVVHPHPTVSEAIAEAFHAVEGHAIHI